MEFEKALRALDGRVGPKYYEAVQCFINAGHFNTGSMCTINYEAIENGWCLRPPKSGRHGYIQMAGRGDVPDDVPGSYAYVVSKMGKEHADRMNALGGFEA